MTCEASQPLVSIVIPTYDRAGFVETAIESVLGQDYGPLELIVLDDGSRDATPALLERIAERADPARFRWARHDNVGQAATINRGFAEARGELLGYLSSDDALLPGAITRLVAEAEAHPDAEVIYPHFEICDEADAIVDTATALEHSFVDAVRWAVCMPGVGALVRRSLYERIGGWDPRYRTCPDYEWWLRARDARFLLVPEALGVWRAHGGSITHSQLDMHAVRERLRVIDELYADETLPQELLDVRDEAYSAMLVQCATMLHVGDGTDGRYAVRDALGPVFSRVGKRELVGALAVHEAQVMHRERGLEAARQTVAEVQRTVAALNETLAQRDAEIDYLRRRLEEEHAAREQARADAEALALAQERAAAPRPLWLRAGRRVTPPALRHEVGVQVHRLRRRVGGPS